MTLGALVSLAASRMASDLHLEVGLPATIRRQGELVTLGEPLTREDLDVMLHEVVDPRAWDDYVHRRSHDISRVISGVRCRINALHSRRGPGLAVRLLPGATPTLEGLNLHPDLVELAVQRHGLVLVSGATGSGKSSTLAALLQEINLHQRRHIVTIEEPIEFRLRPQKAFIRQREVGRDTPSFAQALVDALRQDPDVLMVGELREPEVMRLTLNAAETGHLVLATVHSATAAEALQRLVNAFPAEVQRGIAGQLADCLLAVVCQRLIYRKDLDLRIPECEILRATSASRSIIRQMEFSKLTSVLETGGGDGMFTWDRYRTWLDARRTWSRAVADREAPEEDPVDDAPRPLIRRTTRGPSAPKLPPVGGASAPRFGADAPPPTRAAEQETVFEIDAGADLQSVVKDLVED
ncbi:MAG: ATPase, T2SS/T4P/T4SS family [Pseudomonadota bacterium]